MKRFTEAVKSAIKDENWFAALFIALALPDICGELETPRKPIKTRYIRWFNSNLGDKYLKMFSGEDCYYFRCACLHQGLDTHGNMKVSRIHFIPPPPNNSIIHCNNLNNILQMQIDIFCNDVAKAVDLWEKNTATNNKEISARIDQLIKIYPLESISPFITIRNS